LILYLRGVNTFQTICVIVLSLGALQGLSYGIILLRNQGPNKAANKYLAFILLFFSYRLAVEVLQFFGLGIYDFWYHILLEYNWIYGALIYFFVLSIIKPDFKLSSKDWIHFLPVLLEFLWSNFIKFQNFYWDGTRESLTWLGYWGYVVWVQFPTMYLICGGLILYYSFKAKAQLLQIINTNIEVTSAKVQWVLNLLLVLQIFSIFFMAITLVDLIFFNYAFDSFYRTPLFLGLAIITYGLGLIGFSKRDSVIIKQKKVLTPKEDEELTKIVLQLNNLMKTQKVYTNPELTLRNLAEQLNIKSYLLTKCLNLKYGKSFNTYINEKRIEELKSLLEKPENKKITLLGLAFEVGFNSKASFNRSVKKITGKSPKALKIK